MRPLKGLHRDSLHENQPPDTLRRAVNMVYNRNYTHIEAELGNELFATIEGKIIGSIDGADFFIVFSLNDVTGKSIISYANKEGITQVLNTSYLNFNLFFPIGGDYRYDYNGDIIIAFTDGDNVPRLININNIGIKLDENLELLNEADIVHTRLFSSSLMPILNLDEVLDSGGSLLTGIYYVTIDYKLNDGSYTKRSTISNPIMITKSSKYDLWTSYEGSEGNESTSKAIKMSITNMDTRYKEYRVTVIKKSAGQYEYYIAGEFPTTSTSFIINRSTGEATSAEDILTSFTQYNKVRSLVNIDNQLILGGLETDDKVDYQKYANLIGVKWTLEDEVSLNSTLGSYLDPITIYSKRGFFQDEIYAFYIRLIKVNGNKTRWFHIPGRPPLSGYETANAGNLDRSIYKDAKVFHMNSTAQVLTNTYEGLMGYWHNDNEFYPITEDHDFDSTSDYNGNALGGNNLEGVNVRHHKFPNLAQLKAKNINVFTQGEGTVVVNNHTAYLRDLASIKYNAASWFAEFDTAFTPIGAFYNDSEFGNEVANVIFQNPDDRTIEVTLFGAIQLTINGGTYDFKLEVTAAGNSLILDEATGVTSGNGLIDFNSGLTVTLSPGESIKIECRAYGDLDTDALFSLYNCTEIRFDIKDYGIIGGDQFAKPFGIKLENIIIPDELQDSILGYEIGYAERTLDNTSVVAHSTITDENRFYNFDLIRQNAAISPSHIDLEFNLDELVYPELDAIINTRYKVTDFRYVPRNNPATEPSNINGEDHIYVGTALSIPSDAIGYLALLKSFKPNVYSSFYKQRIINTGRMILKDRTSTPILGGQTTAVIYGGDTFISLHGVHTYGGPTGEVITYRLYPCYTIANIGMRQEGDNFYDIFYPRVNLPDDKIGVGTTYTGNPSGDIWDKIIALNTAITKAVELPEYIEYNNDYNSLNDIEPSLLFDPNVDYVNEYPNRIQLGLPQDVENKENNWRRFPTNLYYESASNKGELYVLGKEGSNLLIQHRYALYIAKTISQLNIDLDTVAALGDSKLFDIKPQELIPDQAGYVGCQSKFAFKSSVFGTTIIDRDRGIIFIYKGGQVDEINKYGLDEFLKLHLNYKEESIDDVNWNYSNGQDLLFSNNEEIIVSEGSSFASVNVDNPFNQYGYYSVYDDTHKRFIFGRYQDGNHLVFSYYPEIKKFLSFHDYTPNYMMSNRLGVFSIQNNNNLYKHGVGEVCNFYGTVYPPSIDVVINEGLGVLKRFDNLRMITTCEDYDNNRIEVLKTFDEIIIYSYHRYSGIVTLVRQTFTSGNLELISGEWNYSIGQDVLKDKTAIVINKTLVDELASDIDSKLKYTNWMEKESFFDKFIVARLTLNDVSNDKIIVKEIKSNIQIIER